MVDCEDGRHDRVAVLSDSPAPRARDFGDEAMRVE